MAELIAMCSGIFSVPIINECIVTPLKNHITYAFTLHTKLQRLRKQVEGLQNTIIELRQSVSVATRNGEQIYEKVATWLSSAEKDIQEAEELLQGEAEAKRKCCSGFCPNLKTQYHLSKKAHKKALEIDEQLKNAQALNPISFCPPLQPIVERGEALQSRVVILDQIVDALKDPNLNPVLVYGMGGIGKTTLAKEVQAAALKLFDDVVFVAVSETPDLRRIQREIADSLGLKFKAEEAPERAKELHNRLNNNTKKVLFIFDDVWQNLDLYAIGILSGDDSEACKIFLTSRKRNVLCSEMRTKKEFPLGLLEEEEAWRLFEKILKKDNDPAEFLADNPEFWDIGKKVVNKCGGLPLLIEKVATDLRNDKKLYAWEDMLKQLEDVEGTEIEDKVHKVIESSYNSLKDEEAKSLFLLCPLFGNSNIPVHELLIYCVGLGLFKHMDSIEGSRNRVLTLIDKLKNESLLLEGDKAGFVKIHDVVRDIAAAIALREHCAFVGEGEMKSPDLEIKDCRRISLPYCEIPKLPEVLQCPEAEVFLLFAELESLYIPDSYFQGVTKLKVLHFSGVSFVSGLPDSGNSISELPSSLGLLTGLQTLSLEACVLNNVAIVGQLKQLKVLSFSGSNVRELPREIEEFAQLKLLDLRGCKELKVIPSNVLSKLQSLEELYMLDTFDEWGEEGNANVVELKKLSCLKTLEIKVKDDKLLPEDWFFNGIQNYKILIGDWNSYLINKASTRMLMLELKTRNSLMHRIKEFMGGIEVLYLREVNGIEKLLYDSSMENMNSFQRLQCLHLMKCDSLREVLPFSSEKCLSHLQEMKVDSCDNVEAIVGEGNEGEVMKLTELTSLELVQLPHLRGFCRTSETVTFPSLTTLDIIGCNSLKYVFTTSMLKSLQQLKKLKIASCDSVEEIILVTICEAAVVFPELDCLQLVRLPNLKRFIREYPVSFPNLTSLEIANCNSLKYVFTISMTKSLQQLKKLVIKGCRSMEWIMLFTKCGEVVEFPELKTLEIANCSSLKNFVWKDSDRSSNNESRDEYFFNELVTLPNLKIMCIEGMGNMKYLWHQQFANKDSFSKLGLLKILNCEKLSAVFPSDAYRRFERLKSLVVSHCNSVKEIYEYDGVGCQETNVLQPFDLQPVSFPNQTSLMIIRRCNSLKYVFTTSMAKSLKQLIKLVIEECGSMEGIMLFAKCEEVVEFPELNDLKIENCSSLKNFVWKDSDRSNNNESRDEYFFNELVTLPNLKTIHIEGMGNMKYPWHQRFADKDSFAKLESLRIMHCEKISAVFPSNAYRQFERLESLVVSYCNSVKEIYEYEGVGCEETNVLQPFALQQVRLGSLPSLKHVFPESIACGLLQLQELEIQRCGVETIIAERKNEGSECASIRTFEWPKLKTLSIHGCDKLIKIQKVIPNVEVLKLDHHSLKAITKSDDQEFPRESWKLEEVTLKMLEQDSVPFLIDFLRGISSAEELVLKGGSLGAIFLSDQQQQYHLRVKRLQLIYVSKLKHIDSKLDPNILQFLQYLNVWACNDMMNIAPSSSSVSFINLTTLHVSWCEKMTRLVTASTAKSMIQLTELVVEGCNMMKYIIVANEDGDCTEEHDDVITFNKLKELRMRNLPSLNSFCSGNYNFNFPLLEEVSIWRCNQMKNFGGGEVSTPKLQRKEHEDGYVEVSEGNLNATIASQITTEQMKRKTKSTERKKKNTRQATVKIENVGSLQRAHLI